MSVQVLHSAGEVGCLPRHHADIPVDLHEARLVHLVDGEGAEHGEFVVRFILPVPSLWVSVRITLTFYFPIIFEYFYQNSYF